MLPDVELVILVENVASVEELDKDVVEVEYVLPDVELVELKELELEVAGSSP